MPYIAVNQIETRPSNTTMPLVYVPGSTVDPAQISSGDLVLFLARGDITGP